MDENAIIFLIVVVGIFVLWFLISWIDKATQHFIGRLLGFKDPKKQVIAGRIVLWAIIIIFILPNVFS
jgi:ABC-type phosphate transport system permease subunit|tara:strand:- start:48 stop:251 length:204 start_codon:yes stop_codon:yes gene_type:complete